MRGIKSAEHVGFGVSPSRTALYRTRKRLSEEYMEKLKTERSLRGLSLPGRRVRHDGNALVRAVFTAKKAW